MSHFAWLATGPDTMPEEARNRLHDLLTYWKLFQHGRRKSTITREEWLAASFTTRFGIICNVAWPIDAVKKIAYADAPFLRWLPKLSSFGATR